MSLQPGDVIWVTDIYPRELVTVLPALGVTVVRNGEIKVAFVNPETYKNDINSIKNHWYFDHAVLADWNDLTDEQIRLVTLWKLKHG